MLETASSLVSAMVVSLSLFSFLALLCFLPASAVLNGPQRSGEGLSRALRATGRGLPSRGNTGLGQLPLGTS